MAQGTSGRWNQWSTGPGFPYAPGRKVMSRTGSEYSLVLSEYRVVTESRSELEVRKPSPGDLVQILMMKVSPCIDP